ncbi:hypothetical protein [Mucilaginibacter sp.]|uniref:hypothetical protein n=1 Tax=Mucilaginibacter sp. TaxID=1882438 RepID=UPI0026245DC4|nr:hypothetical protein [Mucilaginibacter sp.]MDB5031630.1 hypothetical protein [Mucilaginibacter sp.]
MNIHEKITQTNSPTRRKFVWGIGTLSAFAAITAAFKLPFFSKKKAKNKTVKMLTEDGRLVEINASLITTGKKKVTNRELQNWIKK